jgi:CDP-ribitol ribitolphosphotransferase
MSIGSRDGVDGRRQTTASAEVPRGPLPSSGLEVVDAAWERIQLHLTVRAADGRPIPAAGELHLRPLAAAGPTLPSRAPMRASAPGARTARFTVFCAADQMPLAEGRWELVLRLAGQDPPWSSVARGATLTTEAVTRDFPWYQITYRVLLDEAAAGASFGLRIVVDGTRPRSWTTPRGILRELRELRRRSWVGLFNLLVRAVGRLPRRSPSIVLTSDSRSELGGNLKLVHDRMIERGIDRQYRIRTIFKSSIRARRALLDRARLVWLLARAEVILLDDYQPAIYRLPQRPERQRIIQLWHAWGAFKTVGYSRIGKPGGPNPWSRVHKNYTHAVVSSEHEVPFYAEAFGLPDDRPVPTGTPRMDDFLDPGRQATRRGRALELLPAATGRRVILFAPTFRGRSARGADYPVEVVDVAALHATCLELDAVAVLRLHPFVSARVPVAHQYRDRIIEASDLALDTNDLLLISDVLVTDYSSLIFEFSSLGRPMLFFAYDLEEYVATRDTYEPYESFVPGRIVRTFDELIDALRTGTFEQEKVEPFARRHLPSSAGSATDRIIDELVLGGRG